MNWTPEATAKLTKLWAEGISCGRIAKVLKDGCTRSAVIGKVHRLKLPRRETPSRPSLHYTRRGNPKISEMRPATFRPVLLCSTAQGSLNIAFDDLTPKQCRWATSLDRPHTFCGHPAQPGKPYCEAHCERAYSEAYAPLARAPQEHIKDPERASWRRAA